MPKFVNTNAHPVRVKDDKGNLRRVRSGEVVSADGALADSLKDSRGVESASDEHEKAWQEKLEARRMPSGETRDSEAIANAHERVVENRRSLVSDPLQVVIGDAEAPFGPEPGVVTTKTEHLEGTDDPLVKLAFGEAGAVTTAKVAEQGQRPSAPPADTVVHPAPGAENDAEAVIEATPSVQDAVADQTENPEAQAGEDQPGSRRARGGGRRRNG
jgi:hypothetical protein